MTHHPRDDEFEVDDPLARAIHEWLDPERFARGESDSPAATPGLDDGDARRLVQLVGETSVGSAARPEPTVSGLEVVGPYRIASPLGSGGVGHVFRAVDTRTGDVVALKVLRDEWQSSPREMDRFRREADAARRVSHPHCVRLLDAGEADRRLYAAFELIEGEGLDERLRVLRAGSRTMPIDQALAIGADVADALAAIHTQGIIHRDVKPSNVRLTTTGRAVLVDFGLAAGGELGTLTRTGEFAGSIPYAPPEQIERGVRDVDARADVYSLGATLYECLTGKPVFSGASMEQLILAMVGDDPAPPSTLVDSLRKDVDAVLLKSLEKNPRDRYVSATAFANDLRALAAGSTVTARRPGLMRRAARLARRKPWTAAAIGACVVLLAVLPAALYLQRSITDRQRVEQERRTAAEKSRAENNLSRGLDTIRAIVEKVQSPELRNLPNGEAARRLLLEDARNGYERLIAENPGDRTTLFDAAHAMRSLGALAREINDMPTSLDCFARAVEYGTALLALEPNSIPYLIELSDAHVGLASVRAFRGELDGVDDSLADAEELIVRARTIDPKHIDPRRGMVGILEIRTQTLQQRGLYAEAEAALREAVELQRGVAGESGSVNDHRGLAQLVNNLATSLERQGRLEDAASFYAQAIEVLENSLKLFPLEREVERNLAMGRKNLATNLSARGHNAEAIALLDQVRTYCEKQLELVPSDDVTRRLLGLTWMGLAGSYMRLGNHSACDTHHDHAVTTFLAIAAASPGTARFEGDVGLALANRAIHHAQQKRVDAARKDYASAVEHLDAAIALAPDVVEFTALKTQIAGLVAKLPPAEP